MKITVVIPAYNEGQIIAKVISDVKGKVSEVVVIDDGSKDNTFETAKNAGAIVARHFLNRGQGAALQTGIQLALNRGADIIVTFDADGQHLSEEISQLVQPLLLGEVDVVLGSRFLKTDNKIPQSRIVLLKLATLFTKLYTGLKITDSHNGLRAFSAVAAEKIQIRQDGMAHASEIIEEIKRHDFKYKEVGVTIKYTYYSINKGQKLSNSFRIVWDLLLGRLTK